jgi:hypothetical protein
MAEEEEYVVASPVRDPNPSRAALKKARKHLLWEVDQFPAET